MRRLALFCALLLAALLLAALPALAQPLPSIAEKTRGLERRDGFLPVYWDAATGKLYLEVPRLEADMLYSVALPAGLGSNDVGLDRGQLGGEKVVRFERVGPKVLLVEPNLRFRATTDNPMERKAVEDAFAPSVVWGFTALAETDGRVLVDATDFVVRDAHGIARQLQSAGQGTFRLDASRSAPAPAQTKAFPNNTELEARLTFTSDAPGGFVRDVAADPYAVTLRVRQSFIALPPPGYAPRPFDPRAGYFPAGYVDYAAPIGEEMPQRFITRHRLACAAARGADGLCEPTEPIVYYLDPGTPEPVRSALLEGARWWNEAFTAAGYRDAFRVEMLPEDADPLDARYNVIQWVHRATRGWSYGASIVDPRTGEIIKGHVTLGSLRVRQDYLLAEGLLAPYVDGAEAGLPPATDPMLAMALARLRQLSAHEVGHTIGLAHNFAASVSDRASVMDYPAPLARLAGDRVDLSDAYDTGIGAWDRLAVRYGYTDFGPGADEGAARAAILDEARRAGLLYLTDTDARDPGGMHPQAHLWDNGADAVGTLAQEMAVRRAALDRFGPATLRTGRPLATLEEVLVPLYLRHRYQVEAVVKLVGGLDYAYALRGDGQAAPTPVPAARQQAALDALLGTLTPEALRLPPAARAAIPPRPPGYGSTRELFGGRTGLAFDPYAPAEVVATMVFDLLLHPARAARLAYQADFDPALPSLVAVLETTTRAVWDAPVPADAYDAELQRLVQTAWTDALLDLAAAPQAGAAVQARALHHLRALAARLGADARGQNAETAAHRAYLHDQIRRFLARDAGAAPAPRPLPTPPGSPIGQDDDDGAFHHRLQQRRAWLQAHADDCR